MNIKFILIFLISGLLQAQESTPSESYQLSEIHVLTVDSSINPATLDYFRTGYQKALSIKNSAILIKMNTPGGLVTTTKDIMTLMGDSEIPTIVWITPEGASATSAGAIIASAAHLLYMSQGTNIGAATPVGMGDDIKELDGRAKIINDLSALTKSLSTARGRNGEAFAKMISEAKSYESEQAQKENIINGIINTRLEIIKKIHNQEINIKGKKFTLDTQNAQFREVEMDLGQKLLNIFANPTTAYILFMIGAALLYFEFQAPGGFIAGALGVVFLILAGIGFQVLPLNLGAAGLILLAFILFILEVYITSFGVLTIAGIASLIFGSLFLFRSDDGYMSMRLDLVLSTVAGIVAYVGLVVWIFLKKKDQKNSHFFSNEEEIARVTQVFPKENQLYQYQIKVHSEFWNAESPEQYQVGDMVKITKQNTENLKVQIIKS